MLPDFLEEFVSDINRMARFTQRLTSRMEELFRVHETNVALLAEYGGPLNITFLFATPEALPTLAMIEPIVLDLYDFGFQLELSRVTPEDIGESAIGQPLHFCCYLTVAVRYLSDGEYRPRPSDW